VPDGYCRIIALFALTFSQVLSIFSPLASLLTTIVAVLTAVFISTGSLLLFFAATSIGVIVASKKNESKLLSSRDVFVTYSSNRSDYLQ